MACIHPPEERQHVFEGRAWPRADRMLCSLCGELLYVDGRLGAEPGQPVPGGGVPRQAVPARSVTG